MEGISEGLKKYWRRKFRGYKRLNGPGRTRRRWGMRMGPKIKIHKITSSPKKMVLWVRDAYVKMMLSFAKSIGPSATGYGGDATSVAMPGLGRAPPPKEYDDKMIVHIYKSLVMAQGTLVPLPRDPTSNGATKMVSSF